MKRFFLPVLATGIITMLMLAPSLMYSQGSVKGTIRDADTDDPLIGATLLIVGSTSGTVTDLDGKYVIEDIPAGEHVLEVSYTGFSKVTRKINITDGGELVEDFTLGTSATELDMIVVTGTGGPVAKKKIGNTIGSISTKKLAELPVNSFSDILQGREPGMVAFPSSGVTGEGAQIRIRGNASLSQLNEPIILVDGVRVDNGGGFGGANSFVGAGGGGSPSRLDDINPEAIERIEILKGASAATLFGTEASNGVIQIFTKNGKQGRPEFDFKVMQSFINYPKGAFADNTGFATTPEKAAELSSFYGETIRPYQLISRNFVEDLFETGTQTTASATVSGGTETYNFFIGARYSDADGPFGGQDNRNYPAGISTRAVDLDRMGQLNAKLNIFPSEKFNIRISTSFTDRSTETMQNNNNIYGVGSLAQFSKPELAGPNNQTGTIAFATVNETLQITVGQDVRHYNGSIGLNYYPTDWLKLDGTFGIDYSNTAAEEFWPFGWNIDNFSGANPAGFAAFAEINFQALSAEFKATLENKISDGLASNFVLGSQLIRQENLLQSGQGIGFPGPGLEVTGAASAQNVFEFFSEVINIGVFAQEQLSIGNSLYLTVGGRLDAHSAFGTNFNAAFYPKVSFSFIPSDANWWNGFGPITTLQLRGSYGWAGLQPGAFDALTTYQSINSVTGAGIAPSNLGNPDLEPEVSKELELGFTAGLFNDRASLEFTYWDRVVQDALFARQFAPTGGFRNTQLVNIGELSAHGLEITLNGTVFKNRDWNVDLYINGAFLREEITDLGGAPPIKVGGSYPRYRNFLIEGFAPGANFGAVLVDTDANSLPVDIANGDGQPDTKAELIAFLSSLEAGGASLPRTPGTGGVLLRDDDGDGDPLDHYLGKSTPDWQGAFGGTISFKRFSINTTFEYRTGNYFVNNLTDAFRQANPSIGLNLPTSAQVNRDYITGGVDANGNPQNSGEVRLEALEDWLFENLALAPFSGLNTIQKANFVRWRELSLTYKLPGTFIDRLGFRNASFSIAGKNIALFTKYDGVDPEINFVGRGSSALNANFGQGVAAFGWPLPRQVVFTFRVGL